MRSKLLSLISVLFFNLMSLCLIFAIVGYRTDFSFAQGSSEDADPAVNLPRNTELAKDDDDDDDDGDDPMTDNDGTDSDGYDTPPPPTDNDGFDTPPPPTDNDGTDSDGFNTPPPTDNDGVDTPLPEDDRATTGPQTYVFVVRSGDTLSQIAEYLGVPLEMLAMQTANKSMIYPGQKFYYVKEYRADTPPLFTDNEGADSDSVGAQVAAAGAAAQVNQPQNQSYTDDDGIATTAFTSNDGTDQRRLRHDRQPDGQRRHRQRRL